MRITKRLATNVVILDLDGNIKEAVDLDAFSQALDSAIEGGNKKILLNFRGVNFINSSGLGRLVMAVKKISEVGGRLRVAHLGKELADLFTFTRLSDKIPVFEKEEEALKEF